MKREVKLSQPLAGEENRRSKFGMKPGDHVRMTNTLKDAVLFAAQLSGYNRKGEGGLIGYLKLLADTNQKVFGGLLNRVIPLHIQSERTEVRKRTVEEVQADLRARGIPIERIFIEDKSKTIQ